MTDEVVKIDVNLLRDFMKDVFIALEVPLEDAEICAEVLITSDLRGITSHGVQRLKMYYDRIKAGIQKPVTKLTIVKESPTTATIDANHGMGHVAAYRAMELAIKKAKEYGCVIVLKGQTDIVCSPQECLYNTTGNEGMTKGGTGDVLVSLIAGLACKNDLFLAACAGVYINGLAGDELYKKVGPYFNASDLCDQIPRVLKKL